MSKILVAGSLHYDIMIDVHHRPEKGETVIGSGWTYKFGGKGGNQALSAAKSGADVCFFGAVGADNQGRFLLDVLQQHHVETQWVAMIDNLASGTSVAMMDVEGDYGAVVVSNANLHIDAQISHHDDLWQDVGMLLLQNEVPESVNLVLAKEAKKRALMVCMNAAPARELSADLQSLIDVLVVNGVEARDYSGITVDNLSSAEQAALELHKNYPMVVVTAGGDGVAFVDTDGVCQNYPAEKVELVSTHGAGDCFMGSFCTSLLQGSPLSVAVQVANRVAAAHVSKKP
jgi:ribokinase